MESPAYSWLSYGRQVVEASGPYSTLYNYYDHDGLNRVTGNRVKYYDGTDWQWVKRQHEYSATGAILKSTYKTWEDGDTEPAGDALLHAWSQDGKQVQNTDTGGTNYGGVWHWAGSGGGGSLAAGPLRSPNADTASQDAYNVSAGGGAGTPVRRSFIDPTTEGDERNLWAQGMPNAKDSVAAWAAGTISAVTDLLGVEPPVESRFEFKGTVAPTDLSRATDAREKGRVGMFGSGYSYAGSSPRITSETIGRDINPLGRGDGQAYVGGMINLGTIYPVLPNSSARMGQGNSVNNDFGAAGGGGGPIDANDCGCCKSYIGYVTDCTETKMRCGDEYMSMMHTCGKMIFGIQVPICEDPEACRKAKCKFFDCVDNTPLPCSFMLPHKEAMKEACGCEGAGGGGGEGGAIPVGGGCGGCGHSGGGTGPMGGGRVSYTARRSGLLNAQTGHLGESSENYAACMLQCALYNVFSPLFYLCIYKCNQLKNYGKKMPSGFWAGLSKAMECIGTALDGSGLSGLERVFATCIYNRLGTANYQHGGCCTPWLCCEVGIAAMACIGQNRIIICPWASDMVDELVQWEGVSEECAWAFLLIHETSHLCGTFDWAQPHGYSPANAWAYNLCCCDPNDLQKILDYMESF